MSFEILSEDAGLSTEMQLSLKFALSGLPPVSDIAYFHRLKLKAGWGGGCSKITRRRFVNAMVTQYTNSVNGVSLPTD